MQTRLLRVLADGEFYHIGGQVPIKVDVRVIAVPPTECHASGTAGEFRCWKRR